jgi:hypothetical protein
MDLYSAGVTIQLKPNAPADASVGLAEEMQIVSGPDLKLAWFKNCERQVGFAPFTFISKYWTAKQA